MLDITNAALKLINSLTEDSNNVINCKIPIDKIYIGQNILVNITNLLLDSSYLGQKISIISDENTYKVAARKIEKLLAKKEIISIVLPNKVLPSLEVINDLQQKIQNCDSIIAVGSGTINDICKYVTYLIGKPYILFATAPSINGYCSANASIIMNGNKQSVGAQLPKIAIFDLDILSKAPIRLIQSGIGDSLCRSTCQADWLMSHLLFDTYYNDQPFKWLNKLEATLWDNVEGVINRVPELIEVLVIILILSGISMYICQGSYPASQGEHLIAHLLDIKYHNNLYHGEQIAVTTVCMAELQEYILDLDNIIIYPDCITEQELVSYFGESLGIKYFNNIKTKLLSKNQAGLMQKKLSKNWPTIKSQLKHNYIDSKKLKKILNDAKMASTYKNIGWKRSDYVNTIFYSAFTRDRVTFLDLARYSRCLENFIVSII